MGAAVIFNGFEWAGGNSEKCRCHGVSLFQIEDLFQRSVAILPDAEHSTQETRYRAIGKTKTGRMIFLVFTLRHRDDGVFLRPISARFMHAKEVMAYEKENPNL